MVRVVLYDLKMDCFIRSTVHCRGIFKCMEVTAKNDAWIKAEYQRNARLVSPGALVLSS